MTLPQAFMFLRCGSSLPVPCVSISRRGIGSSTFLSLTKAAENACHANLGGPRHATPRHDACEGLTKRPLRKVASRHR